jgi:two-component system chemotaxis response regulator CheB
MARRNIIGVGGSLGALDALKTLLAGVPRDLPAAVFVVLHVGAEGRDLLAGMLDRVGTLPASTAVDGEPVEMGRIYVAPADRHLLVIDDVVRLGRGPRENLARPAIDPLLRSIAASYGARAIGVVLSGTLNDGAAGLADLKRCGGVTVVQNPSEAVASDMPLGALSASDIDYRAPAAELGPLMDKLTAEEVKHSPVVPKTIGLEVDIALGRPCFTSVLEQIADPAPLTCPACNGVLSEIREGPPLRYRCQVGHAYTADALVHEQQGGLDEAIRVALRIVEERAVIMDRMAADAQRGGRTRSHAGFEAKASEFRRYADVLRLAALEEGRSASL